MANTTYLKMEILLKLNLRIKKVMVQDSKKQSVLLKEIENFILDNELSFRIEDDSGDYLFYLTSEANKQFTFEVCSGYVEFYSDDSHDLINYSNPEYILETKRMIKKYLEDSSISSL